MKGMKVGEIWHVKKFNQRATEEWRDDVRDRRASPSSLAFYVFLDRRGTGAFRMTGYVGKTTTNGYVWGKTKREVREKIEGKK